MKVNGRLGEQPGCVQEMRVLNRVVRLTPKGLLYEPGPRHAEILARSLDVTGTRATPGDKTIAIEPAALLGHDVIPRELPVEDPEQENDEDVGASVVARVRCVAFNESPDVAEVSAYCEHYSMHPGEFVANPGGRLKNSCQRRLLHQEVPQNTCKSAEHSYSSPTECSKHTRNDTMRGYLLLRLVLRGYTLRIPSLPSVLPALSPNGLGHQDTGQISKDMGTEHI